MIYLFGHKIVHIGCLHSLCTLAKRRDRRIDRPTCWQVEGHVEAQLVDALSYKPGGRGFDFRCHWEFSIDISFMDLESTQILTEMSTRNIFWG